MNAAASTRCLISLRAASWAQTVSRAGGRAPAPPDAVVVFLLAPLAPPRRMVEVLPPSRLVHPGGLQVAVGQRADPDVFPGRRYDQATDPGHVGGLAPCAVGGEVLETAPTRHPAQPRRRGVTARRSPVLPPVRWRIKLAPERALSPGQRCRRPPSAAARCSPDSAAPP